MELEKVNMALVVGLGISGRAAAAKLIREGKQVVVNDLADSQALRAAAEELARAGAEVELGHHDFGLLDGIDLAVVSPGVAGGLPLLKEARSRGIAVWSEIELAWRYVKGPVVAVTGTNGKTTTVSMIEVILKQAGRPALAAGNIGFPLIDAVEEAHEGDVLVVEVSSFQLAYIEEFQPSVAVLLNIAEDHFDWHEDMEDYIAAKRRLWMNQGEEDLAVVNRDDPLCVEAARGVPSRLAYFTKEAGGAPVTFLKKGTIYSRAGEGYFLPEARAVMRAEELELLGEHNLENAMAAATCALEMGAPLESIRDSLAEFKGLEHRLQLVAEINGVRFYNDSKATNPHATLGALSAFDGPMILILGGRNKGLGFAELASELSGRKGIRLVYVIGEACNEIEEALASEAPDVETRRKPGLEEVFQEMHEAAEPGDSVLFSPACASFDRYDNYKQRGKHYQAMVEKYSREEEGHG